LRSKWRNKRAPLDDGCRDSISFIAFEAFSSERAAT
jgi:hypothetical protein